jgi:ABC-2 type transport system permease protein
MLWMRYRILVNRFKKSGKLSKFFVALLLIASVAVGIGGFVAALLLGLAELEGAEAKHILWIWLVLAVAFLFFWMIGLMAELQRSDSMSFKNLLHLPVSLEWVFLYNYLSSFISLSILIFLPPMLGFALALILVFGAKMLLGLLLVLGFFTMVTALTYQLRGWLARMMEDKRRGRSIVMGITFCFVLLLQVPNMINLSGGFDDSEARMKRFELMQAAGREGPEQVQAQAEFDAFLLEEKESNARFANMISMGAMIIPFGWLPYGMSAAFDGRWQAVSLCLVGLFGIAAFSLARSFRATMTSIVQGDAVHGDPTGKALAKAEAKANAKADSATRGKNKRPLVEQRLPGVSEQSSAIATAGIQSLLRAPEAKMLLLSPIIMVGLFVIMLLKNPDRAGLVAYGPGLSLGAIVMSMLSLQQLLQNQFGLDRAGFRAYLLAPIPRHRILLGKNLALAPIALCIGMIALLALQFLVGLGMEHFLGAVLQLVSAYLILSLIGNQISILGPMRLKEVGMKASGAKLRTVLLQMLSFFLIPISLLPLLLPWAIEYVLRNESWASWLPIYLLLQAVGLLALLVIFHWTLIQQGNLLQQREQQILETLTRN